MDAIIWKSLPDSTNAKEAIHFSMYCQQGKDHDFLHGLAVLKKIADTFEQKYNAECGKYSGFMKLILSYFHKVGKPTYWHTHPLQHQNTLKALINQTKKSHTKEKIAACHKQYINNGRPMDDH